MRAALKVLDSYTTSAVRGDHVEQLIPGRLGVELGQDLSDDLGRLVGRERLAAFGLGYLGREVLDRVNPSHENVSQRFAAGFGILERLDRRGNGLRPASSPRRGRGSWPPGAR